MIGFSVDGVTCFFNNNKKGQNPKKKFTISILKSVQRFPYFFLMGSDAFPLKSNIIDKVSLSSGESPLLLCRLTETSVDFYWWKVAN